MSIAPVLTVTERARPGSAEPARRLRADRSDHWGFGNVDGNVEAVEIVAPDGYCAALLLEHAAACFEAELIPGPGWIVRFRPSFTGGDWVRRLLLLVEGWLQSAPLPCATLVQGERSFLVRAPIRTVPFREERSVLD